jgi:hypothetical protein
LVNYSLIEMINSINNDKITDILNRWTNNFIIKVNKKEDEYEKFNGIRSI